MGRIFLSAGHGGYEDGKLDSGSIAGGTTEAAEMKQLRDAMLSELQSRRVTTFLVPDDLSAQQTIDWINTRARSGDVALELHANAALNPETRGASVFHIANNADRAADANQLLLKLLARVPTLGNRGAQADSNAGIGRLAFCREIVVPSLLVEVGFLTNLGDRSLLQTRRTDFALGLVDGLIAWLARVASTTGATATRPTYPEIGILINDRRYGEPGILVEGNSYIPIDIADSFGIDLAQIARVRRVISSGVVHIRAIELRDYNIAVGWNNDQRAVTLRSILKICVADVDRIMSNGHTSPTQMMVFLQNINAAAAAQFGDLPRLYREEANLEGVNHDIAFAQMCIETDFLRFRPGLSPAQNNFGNLGAADGRGQSATFATAQLGVRAHVQHLKAYASVEPLVETAIDPRFRFVTRGVAPTVPQLAGRWSPELDYGDRILATLRRLYETAQLL